MCNLSGFTARKKIQGYKIVAKKLKGKVYFSIAMGFKYPSDGHIPVVKKQRSIYLEMAKDIILKSSGAYKYLMEGRTAIYIHLSDARTQCYHWKNYLKKGYKLVIVLSEVSKDVMIGSYGGSDVAAGRHIHFIEEVRS